MRKIPIEEIAVGDSAEVSKHMSLAMVEAFAEISGDYNPVHLDASYAANSRYKKPIIHGLMATSLFSGLFGTELPGEGCVYKSQNIRFKRPIYVGDLVTARVEVTAVDITKRAVTFATRCFVSDKVMIDGTAEIFVP